jgi:hypothetical protein
MYRIIKDGESIGLTESPTYIKQAENGCYVLCPEHDASGIVFEGTVYRLIGRDGMEDLPPIMAQAMDGGSELSAARADIEDADAMNVDQEYRLTLLELGLESE